MARAGRLVRALAGSAACSAILGLEAPPPEEDASDGAAGGGGEGGAVGDASSDAGASLSMPMPLAGDGGGATSCSALDGQTVVDDAGNTTWAFFSAAAIPGFTAAADFAGGTFDGRYVYFAGQEATTPSATTRSAEGSRLRARGARSPSRTDATWAFAGAVFDGRYVTFVPSARAGSSSSVAARFDTLAPADFAAPASPGLAVVRPFDPFGRRRGPHPRLLRRLGSDGAIHQISSRTTTVRLSDASFGTTHSPRWTQAPPGGAPGGASMRGSMQAPTEETLRPRATPPRAIRGLPPHRPPLPTRLPGSRSTFPR